jgi:hypothetical protein
MIRIVRPETCTLTLEGGEQLTVKKRLNYGEQNAAHARLYVQGVDGHTRINLTQIALGFITAYLLDWTVTDEDGHLIPIRGLSADDLADVLRSLEPESVEEIKTTIEAHERAVVAERQEKKLSPAGVSRSEATFTSVN